MRARRAAEASGGGHYVGSSSPHPVKLKFLEGDSGQMLLSCASSLVLFLRHNDKIPDTSSADVRKGKDIQGIPWEKLAIAREKYRRTRLEQYKNYQNMPNSGEAVAKEYKPTEKGGMHYEFRQNTRSVKSTILHFQCSVFT